MREILFRGKSKNDGKWYQGDLVTVAHKRFIDDDVVKERVIPETVGQYTDLKDKNGVKIFEGDILKVKTMWHAEFPENENGGFCTPIKKETYWSVEYKNFAGEMGFMVYGIDRRWHTKLTWNKLYNCEAIVVGNIYDNHELLRTPQNDEVRD